VLQQSRGKVKTFPDRMRYAVKHVQRGYGTYVCPVTVLTSGSCVSIHDLESMSRNSELRSDSLSVPPRGWSLDTLGYLKLSPVTESRETLRASRTLSPVIREFVSAIAQGLGFPCPMKDREPRRFAGPNDHLMRQSPNQRLGAE